MMESTLVTDAAGSNSGNNPLFSGDDDDALFGSLDDGGPFAAASAGVVPTNGTGGGSGSGSSSRTDLMGQLLGDNAGGAGKRIVRPVSSYDSAPSSTEAPAETAGAQSKLSVSGLLESASSSGGLFGDDDDDDAAGGGSGGSGLFDDVDAEEAEKERRAALARQQQAEEERIRREVDEAAAQLQMSQDQQTADIMHELNLNDNNGEFMGMGMGLGGEIPISPPPASAPPPAPGAQFQQYPYRPAPPQQQQQQQRQQQGVMNAMAGSYYYSTTGAGQMTGSSGQFQANNASPAARKHGAVPQPSILAGMHVGHNVNLGGVAPSPSSAPIKYPGMMPNNFPPAPSAIANYVPSPSFEPHYGKIVVNDPMLIQGTGLFAGPPHWTYLVTVYAKGAPSSNSNSQHPVSAVRRRFRHFVALEDRLRASVPGAILPPRPDKHPARAIEEATARQSADFAQQRAVELSAYMNALARHPYVGSSPELKLFLMLQDHIGTAWPEVSSSAFTRMTAVGGLAVERMTDAVDGVLSELGTAQQVAAGEDSAEVLALAAYEGRRIGAVTSSVPKIEGCVALVRERGDRLGATGLEMSKLAKDVSWCDRDLAGPMEILSGALLRSGRRTKRLGLELAAAIAPFATQYRTCRYEQMAFADRRTALKRRTEARVNADKRAAKLMMNQTSMRGVGGLGGLDRMETEAAMYDEMASEMAKEADEVATRLTTEVGRIAAIRVKEWDASMKVIAGGMKEACAENAAIWQSALEAFRREFPDCPEIGRVAGGV